MSLEKSEQVFGFTKPAVARSYNRVVNSYDQHNILQRTVGERLLERLDLVKINPNIIIDLGSGTGHCSRKLLKTYKNAKLIGLDLAWKMASFSNQQRRFFSKDRYICADAEYIPLPDNSVDFVFSNLMLYWIVIPDRFMNEVARILKPGGLFMFTTFGPDTLDEMRQSWHDIESSVHVNRFMDMHDVGDSMQQSGFEGIVMDNEHITMTYDSITDLHQDLRAQGETNINIGRRRFLTGKKRWNAYIDNYPKSNKTQNNISAQWEVVYGHGWLNEKSHPQLKSPQKFPSDIKISSL
jgi:malonyl-CoA O-methyltransferase